MNIESKGNRIFYFGKNGILDTGLVLTQNLYRKKVLIRVMEVEVPEDCIKQGFVYIPVLTYSSSYNHSSADELQYDNDGNRKYYFINDKNIPHMFKTSEEAAESDEWKKAVEFYETCLMRKKFATMYDSKISDTDDEKVPHVFGECNDNIHNATYNIEKVFIDNTYPIWIGKNRKGVYKASLDEDTLNRFEDVWCSSVKMVNNDRVYMIRVYRGYDYNYGGNPAIYDVYTTCSQLFHSVTEAKKSKFYKEYLDKANEKPDDHIITNFGIACKEEFGDDEFLYGDVMENRWNLSIKPVRVISASKTEIK